MEQAILQAAWAEILTVGFIATTVDGVAARAGTSKPVLYRRWPSRADLLVAAVDAAVPDLAAAPPNSGDLRADLISVLTGLRDRYQALTVTTGLDGLDDAVLAVLRRRAHSAGVDQIAAVLPDAVPPELVRLPVDAVHARSTLGETLTDTDLAALLDNAVLPLLPHREGRPAPPGTSASPGRSGQPVAAPGRGPARRRAR